MSIDYELPARIIKYLGDDVDFEDAIMTTVTDGTTPWEIDAAANEVWQVEAHMFITDNDTGSDMNGRINAPSGSSGRFGAIIAENAQSKNQTVGAAIGNLIQSGDNNDYVVFTGLVVVGATAGQIQVQMRLHTGTATLTIAAYSYCIFRRIS